MSSACGHDPAGMVARQPIFATLTEEECRTLVVRSVCRAASRGEVLFQEGELCRGLYLVLEGTVRVYRANADGREQVLGIFGAGESLGEVALFDEGPYLASARVMEAGRVLFLPFEEVHTLYRSHPQVMQAVVRELGARVRKMVALVDRLTLQDVPTRVAGAILEYAESAGAVEGGEFLLARTQDELAAELGTARECVARALGDLRKHEIIRQRGRRIAILRPTSLYRAAGRSRVAASLRGR